MDEFIIIFSFAFWFTCWYFFRLLIHFLAKFWFISRGKPAQHELAVLKQIFKEFSIIEFENGSTANVEIGVFNYPTDEGDNVKVNYNAERQIESIEPSDRENGYVDEVRAIFSDYGMYGEETYFAVGNEALKIGDCLTCDRIKGDYRTPHNFECAFRCISFVKAANELKDASLPLERLKKEKENTANIKNEPVSSVQPRREDTSAIPSELIELVTHAKNSDIRVKLDEMLPSDMNISTYAEIFRNLLHLEELNTLKEFKKYTQLEARFSQKSIAKRINGEKKISFVYAMEFEGLHEFRPSILGGDGVRAKCNETQEVFVGLVKRTLLDSMEIRFEKNFTTQFDEAQTYEVKFSYSRSVYKNMHMGVERAVGRLGESFLFPNEIIVANEVQLDVQLENGVLKLDNAEIPWFKQDIDDSQKSAVVQALRAKFRPLPNIVHGPPGTGKTTTLIEVILHVFTQMKDSRILVAAHSNSAANLILSRLLEYEFLKDDIVRLLSMSYHKKEAIPDELRPYCVTFRLKRNDSDEEHEEQNTKTENGIRIFRELSLMAPYRIVVGTCIGLGSLMYDRAGSIPDYTYVVVDEAGQCCEPELLIPISKVDAKNGNVILAGDPMQMPPFVRSTHARERGLSLSFMQRFVERYNKIETELKLKDMENHFDLHLISKLLHNYRSVPSILNFYNKHFYGNELLATISETVSDEMDILTKIQQIMPDNAERNLKHAIFFQNILGKNRQIIDSTSWYNTSEIIAIMAIIPKLLELGFAGDDIGVIAPYHLQVATLRELFASARYPILVGSVDEFQGLERKIVLISTVRTDKRKVDLDIRRRLGIVACPKRTNVAISRARAVVVVFGRAKLLERDDYWRDLINDCKANGTFSELL